MALNKRSGNPQVERTHKDVFANLEYYEIDGVGHFLQMEKPDEVNARLISFIKKVQR